MAPFEWTFPERQVNFTLRAKVVFHPSVSAAFISLPWIDAAGELSQQKTVGPFSSFEVIPDEGTPAKGTSKRWPGAVRAQTEMDLGPLQINLGLVRALQKAVCEISVELEDKAGARVCAGGAARIHLGPLLVAGDRAEDAQDEEAAALCRKGLNAPKKREVSAVFTETIGLAGLYKLELTIHSSVPVLSREMREKLLPVCFSVETVRSLPNELWLKDKCQKVFVEIYPGVARNDTKCLKDEFHKARSHSWPHDTQIRFDEPTVWLLGLAAPHAVRDWLQNEELVVEVHDRDGLEAPPPEEEPPEAAAEGEESEEKPKKAKVKKTDLNRACGVARFPLAPLLDSHNLEIPLRADVLPNRGNTKRRRAEAQLDGICVRDVLGEDGYMVKRYADPKREDTADYGVAGTSCVVRATLAVPLRKAHEIQAEDEDLDDKHWASAESPHSGAAEGKRVFKTKAQHSHPVTGLQPCRAKVQLQDGTEVVGPWRRKLEDAENDEQRMRDAHGEGEDVEKNPEAAREMCKTVCDEKKPGLHRRYERYGRVVILFDDKDTESVQALLQTVLNHNSAVINEPSHFVLATYQFNEEQRADLHLDVLTGFMLLDGKWRLAVVEGLRDQALQKVLEICPRNARGNDESKFKMLYNPDIGYPERLYTDFGPKIRQIKIRMPLDRLSGKSELYSVQGALAADTLAGLSVPVTLCDVKRLRRMHVLRRGEQFPKACDLEQLQILYGAYLSDQEIEGQPYSKEVAASETKSKSLAFRTVINEKESHKGLTFPTSDRDDQEELRAARFGATADPGAATMLAKAVGSSGTIGMGATEQSSKRSRTSKKAQLVQDNSAYDRQKELEKSASAPDFIEANKMSVQKKSEDNAKLNHIFGKKLERETPFLDDEKHVHLYSTMRRNTVELQKEWMRASMVLEQDKKMWTYSPFYQTQSFEYSSECDPGIKPHHPKCPNDTYANQPGDNREPWRWPKNRPKEEYRKPALDVSYSRAEELHEAFVENEWHGWPGGDERHKPVKVEVRFEADLPPGSTAGKAHIPHHRHIVTRPFDKSAMKPEPRNFGPKAIYESCFYHGRPPGVARHEEFQEHNVAEKEKTDSKILHGSASSGWMKSYSQVASRGCVTDMDRYENTLKDKPTGHMPRGKEHADVFLPITIRNDEEFHDHGRPDIEFQARLRENHASPPFDVSTGAYRPRDPNVGTKAGSLSGKLGKAPWRHGPENSSTQKMAFYPSHHDFNTTRAPPKSRAREDFVVKNATRMDVTSTERSGKLQYSRPHHYGVDSTMTRMVRQT
eukprot:gnl/TRDRNA2_/TRDRNA2_161555_c0_seq1.p1 gnl/TRDRNA2_/TRDRNA2_161555_c0~~gnl/TRDRNA2_/TRDRNA2_161555_c0_seq1.p1  ORF type:complete len:1287 (-),score=243.40 gnl/TRDRNA2_/TRDRNA2_161555_c0_seq1:52-3912(-)